MVFSASPRSVFHPHRIIKLSKFTWSVSTRALTLTIVILLSIVAISGLGGHAFGSFKERKGEHMWLRDALPRDVTKEKLITRIMIYGYDSRLTQSDNFQNLEDLGTAFHSFLRRLAIAGTFRPIVFIAHSLGGLIVKQVRTLLIPIQNVSS